MGIFKELPLNGFRSFFLFFMFYVLVQLQYCCYSIQILPDYWGTFCAGGYLMPFSAAADLRNLLPPPLPEDMVKLFTHTPFKEWKLCPAPPTI